MCLERSGTAEWKSREEQNRKFMKVYMWRWTTEEMEREKAGVSAGRIWGDEQGR